MSYGGSNWVRGEQQCERCNFRGSLVTYHAPSKMMICIGCHNFALLNKAAFCDCCKGGGLVRSSQVYANGSEDSITCPNCFGRGTIPLAVTEEWTIPF